MSNLLSRILSSILFLPLFLYVIYLNNFYFHFLLFFIFIVAVYELKILYKNYLFLIFIYLLLLLFILSFYKLRANSLYDFWYLVWFMSIVWLSDIGGYFIGKLLKGPKLNKWSPNKTISGFCGSLIFSQIAFVIFFLSNIDFKYSYKVFISQLFFSLISIFGDLFFSFIKRKFGVKDFSNFIPGHGGLLDRIDGLIFVIIFAFFFKMLYA